MITILEMMVGKAEARRHMNIPTDRSSSNAIRSICSHQRNRRLSP